MEQRMQKRRRFKQAKSLEVRLAEEAVRLREQAQLLPRGRLRDQIEKESYPDRGCIRSDGVTAFNWVSA